MIIKSTTRKSNSFSQLISYLHREASFEARTFNMYGSDKKECLKEFLENAKHIQNSRGKVYMYHEIISIDKKLANEKEILFDLAIKYTELRAKNHLVYSIVHNNTKNPHIHLIISSNEIQNNKRKRLSKKEFKNIQKELEAYKNEKYKELSNSNIYDNRKDNSKQKRREQEMKHKRKKITKKEQIKKDLEHIFSNATSKIYLINALKSKNYEIYNRASIIGVKYQNKKYRLKTLGLEANYNQAIKKIEKIKSRKKTRSDFKESKKQRPPLEFNKSNIKDLSRSR